MNKKFKKFILNKGFSEEEIKNLSKKIIRDLKFEYNYLKRIGMID